MRAAVLIAVIALVVPALAGCTAPGATASPELARPRIGDVAEYRVSGHLLEFARWANGIPLMGDARLRLSVEAADGLAVDGYQGQHAAYRVVEELASGGDFALHRELLVSPEHATIVQSFTPLSNEDSVVAFDERGYPWAWGASLWHGEPLGDHLFQFELPANGGQAAPLAMQFESHEAERVGEYDAHPTFVAHAPSDGWVIWLAPDVPYPVRVDIRMDPLRWAPFVRVDDQRPTELTFRAELVSFTRGDTPIPPRDSSREWQQEPTSADFAAWDREMPPDGLGEYAPFLLADAVGWAKTVDQGFQGWLAGRDDAILYRATYLAMPGRASGSETHVWLVQYVSARDEYYEVQVERTFASAPSGVPDVPLPGITQVTLSRPAEAPQGEHGWFDTSALPERILTIDSGVKIMRGLFAPEGHEIFVRSFDDPAGYSYYIDGGFEEPAGRYTVIVNAQTGFVQSAVGPVRPVVATAA